MKRYRSVNLGDVRTAFIVLIFSSISFGILLFQGCKPDSDSCYEKSLQEYGPDACSYCELLSGDYVAFNIRDEDKEVFPYSGDDTLIFQITRRGGSIDTVRFMGNGAYTKYIDAQISLTSTECILTANGNSEIIDFIPDKTQYGEIQFHLDPYYGYAKVHYLIDSLDLTDIVHLIGNPSYGIYHPVFNYNGQEYYKVTEYSSHNSQGGKYSYFMSKADQLILLIEPDSLIMYKIQ